MVCFLIRDEPMFYFELYVFHKTLRYRYDKVAGSFVLLCLIFLRAS